MSGIGGLTHAVGWETYDPYPMLPSLSPLTSSCPVGLAQHWTRSGSYFFFLIFFSTFFIYFWDREKQSMNGGAEREGDTASETGSRLPAISPEPDTGLKLTDREIVTWLKSDAQPTAPPRRPWEWFLKGPPTLQLDTSQWYNHSHFFCFSVSFIGHPSLPCL